MKLLISGILLFSALTSQLFGQDRNMYIDRYKDIAMFEMARTGIPASIKLAQGILESNAGGSELARTSNNHFGIKCGSEWDGKTHMRKDDDRNRHGKLVKSCFRVFGSSEESFVAHSDFLLDPGKKSRYGFLFDLDPRDYKGWAHGLKKAGYATNPQYPKLLINLIDQYNLAQYDLSDNALMALLSGPEDDVIANAEAGHKITREEGKYARGIMAVKFNNGVEYVVARDGDRVNDVAKFTGTSASKIVRYNENLDDKYQDLESGSNVYLEKKKGKYKGSQKFHMVRLGQDMIDIAQKYAIRLDKLYKHNRMEPGTEPANGEKIYLRGTRRQRPVLRLEKQDRETAPPHDEIFLPPITAGETSIQVDAGRAKGEKQDHEVGASTMVDPEYVVQKGDTLYQISRIHGVNVNDLRKMNNLDGDTIHPGQRIKLSQ